MKRVYEAQEPSFHAYCIMYHYANCKCDFSTVNYLNLYFTNNVTCN